MQIQDRPPPNLTPSPLRNVALREFVMRQDRVPRDQRVDLPEIQESFRVSFSDAALAASVEDTRNVMQKATPTDERGAAELQLRAYLAIAAL
ncbi:MAG: hypothetical protein H6R14_3064 [Proteobacteria bacterium]|nr:hypothetical protein [Pseudomonadota bacterium]